MEGVNNQFVQRVKQVWSTSWSGESLWVNPVFRQLEAVVKKIIVDVPKEIVLIMPIWKDHLCFQLVVELQKLVLDTKMYNLPERRDLFLLFCRSYFDW